jgi:hypothetical protein
MEDLIAQQQGRAHSGRCISLGILALAIGASGTAGAQVKMCKNEVCVQIDHVSDTSKPSLRAIVTLSSSRLHNHYNVIVEKNPQFSLSSTEGASLIELHKGERNFSVQACYNLTDVNRSECTKWANFSDEVAAPPAPPPRIANYMKDVDLPGSDYRNFETTKRGDAECGQACFDDSASCKAWTWTRPGVQAANGKCWLKDAVPTPVANNCCVSGLRSHPKVLGKRLGKASPTSGGLPGIWDSVTGDGIGYTLTLDQQGHGLVGATVAKLDGTLDGTLSADGTKLSFIMTQPKVGVTSRGNISLGGGGDSFSGTITRDIDGVPQSWTGTRRK